MKNRNAKEKAVLINDLRIQMKTLFLEALDLFSKKPKEISDKYKIKMEPLIRMGIIKEDELNVTYGPIIEFTTTL